MKKSSIRNQSGFTAVELLITLFIAAIFLLAGYQLYMQLNASGADAGRKAAISDLVYTQLSNAHQYVATGACTPNTSIPAQTPTVTGFSSVSITTTVTCPFSTTGGGAANVSLITVKATYTYSGNTDTLSHAQYTAGQEAAAPTPTTYAIGDTGPGGGIVFYDAGSTQSWGRYLEAAPANWNGGSDPSKQWCVSSSTTTSSGGSAIGAGKQNTENIIGICYQSDIAAKAAKNYTGGGKNDWYLPSKDELVQLYLQRGAVGGFTAAGYWSSTYSYSTYYASYYPDVKWFNGGSEGSMDSDYSYYVRPIRAF